MEYEKRIVCFFDILGFSDLVEKKKLAPRTIGKLFTSLGSVLKEYNRDGNVRIDQFSDCFVVSILSGRSSPEQIRLILAVLSKLLGYKLIARGSLVYGEIIHKKGRIYGPALVKAVRLEKDNACYPRIILDESLNDLILPTVGNADISYTDYFAGFYHIARDTDGYCYVDYISFLRDRAEHKTSWENLQAITREGVKIEHQRTKEKYDWLESKITKDHSMGETPK